MIKLPDLSEDLKTNIALAGLPIKNSYNILEASKITGIPRTTLGRMINAGILDSKPSLMTRRVTLLSLDKYYKNDN